jgi:hypothetical protein
MAFSKFHQFHQFFKQNSRRCLPFFMEILRNSRYHHIQGISSLTSKSGGFELRVATYNCQSGNSTLCGRIAMQLTWCLDPIHTTYCYFCASQHVHMLCTGLNQRLPAALIRKRFLTLNFDFPEFIDFDSIRIFN